MFRFLSPLLVLAALAFVLVARPSDGSPIEIGKVEWGRDLDVALATSKETGKPVFLLFQEVPG